MLDRLYPTSSPDFIKEKSISALNHVPKVEREEAVKAQTEQRDVCEFDRKDDFCVSYGGETYTSGAKLVDRLKAEQAEVRARFLQTVKDTIFKQSTEISGDGIWKVIASGDYEVELEIQKAAEEAISEDGYWGVKQTSQRIVSFAKALVGGDVSRLDEMKDAFIKGFEAAEAAWGGALPGIAAQTYDAVMELFDEWAQEGTKEVEA